MGPLAGVPADVRLFALMAPHVRYAIFGTSRSCAVGPMAVVNLTASAAAAAFATRGTPESLGAAIALALISPLLL